MKSRNICKNFEETLFITMVCIFWQNKEAELSTYAPREQLRPSAHHHTVSIATLQGGVVAVPHNHQSHC